MKATFDITEKDGKVTATMQLDEAAMSAAKAEGSLADAGKDPLKYPVLFAAYMVTRKLEEFGKEMVSAGRAVDTTEAEQKKHDRSLSIGDVTLE